MGKDADTEKQQEGNREEIGGDEKERKRAEDKSEEEEEKTTGKEENGKDTAREEDQGAREEEAFNEENETECIADRGGESNGDTVNVSKRIGAVLSESFLQKSDISAISLEILNHVKEMRVEAQEEVTSC